MNSLALFIKYRYAIIISFLIGTIGILYCYNQLLKENIDELNIMNKQTEQNFLAYQDSINQLPDSIQMYNVFVRELNNRINDLRFTNESKDNQITLLHNRIIILGDTIRFLKRTIQGLIIENPGTDSVSYAIPIYEENNLVKVFGDATVYPIQNSGTYQINIFNKDMIIDNYLDFNVNDSLITAYTKINDGKLLKSNTTISPTLHSMLIRNVNELNTKSVKRFFYGTEVNIITDDFDQYKIVPSIFANYLIWNGDKYKIRLNGLSGYNDNVFVGLGFRIEL